MQCRIFSLLIFMFFLLGSHVVWAAQQINTVTKLYYPTLATVAGNLQGKVTVVEFFDYRCSYCREMAGAIAHLINIDPNVRVVYRDYPILGESSLLAARTVLAAQLSNQYEVMQRALWNFNQPLNNANILQISATMGINSEQLKKNMNNAPVTQQLQENLWLGKNLGVEGTPTFILALTPNPAQQQPVVAYLLTSPTLEQLQSIIGKLEQSA